jgi:exodeoxyribonuclease III
MFRVITCNVNGLRAAQRKGFVDWVISQQPDVLCLQETKVQLAVETHLQELFPGYQCFFSDAIKKGYSGTAIYTRHKPDRVVNQLGWLHADDEGRYVHIELGSLTIASLYLPSGTTGDVRQAIKFDFMDQYFNQHLKPMKSNYDEKKRWILTGDWNIAHQEIDIKNWRGNLKSSGFLPEERAWISHLLDEGYLIDAFRTYNPEPNQYTWWSYRARAWDSNAGWRIDYHMVSPNLKDHIKEAKIYKDQRFSDHAPLTIDYSIT